MWLGNALSSCSTVNINAKKDAQVTLHSAVLITEITIFLCLVCIMIHKIRQSKYRKKLFLFKNTRPYFILLIKMNSSVLLRNTKSLRQNFVHKDLTVYKIIINKPMKKIQLKNHVLNYKSLRF